MYLRPCDSPPSSCSRLRRLGRTAALLLTLSAGGLLEGGLGPPLGAQTPPSPTVTELRRELEELRIEYETRLADLEARIDALESGGEQPPAADQSAESLQAAAQELLGGQEATPEESRPATTAGPSFGGERSLNRLNPEISFSGDVLAIGSDAERDEFQAREFELAFQATLDPFTVTKWFLAVGPSEGEVELEEGYATFNRLGHGLHLTAGKIRQSFGLLNRWHLHSLPQTDYPLVLRSFFGDEGLTQTGLSLDWLMPRLWADANELSFQITDGENEAFGGELFEDLSALVHLKSYWDLDPSTYFEWGLSAIAGRTERGGSSRVYGTDLSYHWQPPWRAKYREVTLRTELLHSERDDELDVRRRAWGLYAYAEGLVRRNLYLGLRYDRAEDPLLPDEVTWSIFPYVTWWQSEYVRLRAEYGFERNDLADRDQRRFTLQLTWAAGPHKHERY